MMTQSESENDRQLLETFTANGYASRPGWLTPQETASLRAWADELASWAETPGRHMMYFETPRGEGGPRLLNRMENFWPYHAGMRSLIDGPKLAGVASTLFGEPAALFKEKINFKLPGGGGFAAHQDVQAGWERYGSLHITAMVAIDACTPDNGCLEVVAGWHDRGLIGSSWEPLTEEQTAAMDFQPLPMQPGDAVFFDSFAPHRSAPNHTTEPRRVLYVTFNRASEGDFREQYYADKRASYPPDCEREPGKDYSFRV